MIKMEKYQVATDKTFITTNVMAVLLFFGVILMLGGSKRVFENTAMYGLGLGLILSFMIFIVIVTVAAFSKEDNIFWERSYDCFNEKKKII